MLYSIISLVSKSHVVPRIIPAKLKLEASRFGNNYKAGLLAYMPVNPIPMCVEPYCIHTALFTCKIATPGLSGRMGNGTHCMFQ